jgi:hypothetical protein
VAGCVISVSVVLTGGPVTEIDEGMVQLGELTAPDGTPLTLPTDLSGFESATAIPEWFGRSTHELLDLRRVRNRRRETRK